MSKFLEYLKWLPNALKLIGALIPLVKGLVEGFETPGHGEEKKQAVLEAVEKVIDQAGAPEGIKTFALWVVGFVIDAIVAIKNAVGEFKRSVEPAE